MFTVMKICGMLLVVFCTTSIGISLAGMLSRRVEELETAVAVVAGLESELSYSLAPPDQAVARLEERETLSKAAYLPACVSLCRKGTVFPEAWKQAVDGQRGALSQGDTAILCGLSDTLGQVGLDGQLAQLAHAKSLLQLQLDSARDRCASHAKLYRTMGLLSGAFVVILFL